jgi:hypothetical protein
MPDSTQPHRIACALALLAAASCGGGAGPAAVAPRETGVRAASTTTDGHGEALAAAFLWSAGRVPAHGIAPHAGTAFSALAARLDQYARHALEIGVLATGNAPFLVGSERVRRLAREPGAPPDRNGNGTNIDETLADELARFAELAGASFGQAATPALFPLAVDSAELAAPPGTASVKDHAAWRAPAASVRVVDAAQVGAALLARTLAGTQLAFGRRGARIGTNGDDGVIGLALLASAQAIEETTLRALFFDGEAMVGIVDPRTYDPTNAPRWVPRTFRVIDDGQLPGAPAGYVPEDRASDLTALARLLLGAAELAWLGAADNPFPELRELFHGRPFGVSGPPIAPEGGNDLSFVRDIQPTLQAKCIICHDARFPTSAYSVASYESVLAGGMWAKPAVVPGDHAASPLWLLLSRDWTPPTRPFPIPRMPAGGPFLPPAAIDVVAAWIDQGAPKEPRTPPQPPVVGLDLGRVLFANLRELHTTPATGAALHTRFVRTPLGDGGVLDERSRHVDARATGHALAALSAWMLVDPTDPAPRAFCGDVAAEAARLLVGPDGVVARGFDLDTGTPDPGRDLGAQAALTRGLLAAGRGLGAPSISAAGEAAGRALVRDFFDPDSGLFAVVPGIAGGRYGPDLVADVLDALRELYVAGLMADAARIHDRFLAALLPALVFSELDGLGEVLGDGIADTDGNGIREPDLAGGRHGLAPRFAASIVAGPDPVAVDGPVSWSRQILPLFRANCAVCHMEGAELGRYRIDTPGLAARAGESGFPNLIVPGDPERSLLYRKLVDRPPPVGEQMPQGRPPLGDGARSLVRQWILEGARDR